MKKSLKGFSDLRIFPVTLNDSTGYTVGAVIKVPGAQAFTRTPETSDWKEYSDDVLSDSGSDWLDDKVTIQLSQLPLELKKYFEGGDYDEEKDEYTFKSISEAPELALAFKCMLRDKSWLMKKFYSFKATSLKDEHKTQGENGEPTPVTIEGIIMSRIMDTFVKKEKNAATSADLVWLNTMDTLPLA